MFFFVYAVRPTVECANVYFSNAFTWQDIQRYAHKDKSQLILPRSSSGVSGTGGSSESSPQVCCYESSNFMDKQS